MLSKILDKVHTSSLFKKRIMRTVTLRHYASIDSSVLESVELAIAAVQKNTGYGSIEITVHDGRVTQIERREKVRFEHLKKT